MILYGLPTALAFYLFSHLKDLYLISKTLFVKPNSTLFKRTGFRDLSHIIGQA
jgi:hypothetical protein